MTVASLRSVLKRSPTEKVTRSATPAFRAFSVLSRIRTGSMSIPTPRAPKVCAAVITKRPSPHPRS